MSKDAIITELCAENARLKSQLNQLLQLIYGQTFERLILEILPDQLSLFESEALSSESEVEKEHILYERKKCTLPGRNSIPEHLPHARTG